MPALLSIAAYALLIRQVYDASNDIIGALAHNNLALHQMCCDLTTGTESPLFRLTGGEGIERLGMDVVRKRNRG